MISFSFLEAILVASSLSLDAFVVSVAYGSSKIRISRFSSLIVTAICSLVLGISLFVGLIAKQYLPDLLTATICFMILCVLGFVKLFDSFIKSLIKNYTHFNKEIEFSMFNLRFILHLYANPKEADVDFSKTISPTEAVSLAIALSLDGLAVGFGAALGNINVLTVFLTSFLFGYFSISIGGWAGNRLAQKTPYNLSWLSGIVLIFLAFSKLF